jgi:hypothetical protein
MQIAILPVNVRRDGLAGEAISFGALGCSASRIPAGVSALDERIEGQLTLTAAGLSG